MGLHKHTQYHSQSTRNKIFYKGNAYSKKDWCKEGDLNPHGSLRWLLRPVRLPISPSLHIFQKTWWVARDSNPEPVD